MALWLPLVLGCVCGGTCAQEIVSSTTLKSREGLALNTYCRSGSGIKYISAQEDLSLGSKEKEAFFVSIKVIYFFFQFCISLVFE